MMRTYAAMAAAIAASGALIGDPATARQSASADLVWEHRIVSGYVPEARESGFDLRGRMNELGARGFRFATLVHPRPPLLAEEPTVILAKSAGGSSPPAVRFEVLTADTATLLQTQAAARVAQGFVIKGITAIQWQVAPKSRPGDAIVFMDASKHALRYVAILEAGPEATRPESRIVETWTERNGWRPLTDAQREGFRVTQSVWLAPRADLRTPEHVLFLMERRSGSGSHEWSIPTTQPPTDLSEVIEKEVKKGFRVEHAWSTTDRIEVLFTKPAGGASSAGGRHRISDSTSDTNAMFYQDGRVVGTGYRPAGNRNHRVFIHDQAMAGYRYDFVSGVFPRSIDDTGQLGGVGFIGLGAPPETEQACVACQTLNERGAAGYRAAWATVGPGYKYRFRMEVLLERGGAQ